MDKSARFWDKIAERYSRNPISDEATYQKKLQITREHFRPDMNVLEFGCGTGSTAIEHAPYVKHIRATDISEKMLEIARAKAEAGNVENVTFEQVTLEELGAPDESFDVVMGHNIVHLLEDKEAALATVYKVIKPGGVFVSSTACLGDKLWFLKFIGPIGRFLGLIPLFKVFTVQELKDSLADAGFEIDYEWQPDKSHAVFIVAKKPG